jgi:hypothetical protein
VEIIEGEHMTVKSAKNTNSSLKGYNQVRLVGILASATTSREGVFARRLEIPQSGAREIFDLECEKEEIIPVFRSMKVREWVEVRGRIRRRFWRAGGALASRTYIEVTSISPR